MSDRLLRQIVISLLMVIAASVHPFGPVAPLLTIGFVLALNWAWRKE